MAPEYSYHEHSYQTYIRTKLMHVLFGTKIASNRWMMMPVMRMASYGGLDDGIHLNGVQGVWVFPRPCRRKALPHLFHSLACAQMHQHAYHVGRVDDEHGIAQVFRETPKVHVMGRHRSDDPPHGMSATEFDSCNHTIISSVCFRSFGNCLQVQVGGMSNLHVVSRRGGGYWVD